MLNQRKISRNLAKQKAKEEVSAMEAALPESKQIVILGWDILLERLHLVKQWLAAQMYVLVIPDAGKTTLSGNKHAVVNHLDREKQASKRAREATRFVLEKTSRFRTPFLRLWAPKDTTADRKSHRPRSEEEAVLECLRHFKSVQTHRHVCLVTRNDDLLSAGLRVGMQDSIHPTPEHSIIKIV